MGVAERPPGTKRQCGWERVGVRWVERCVLGPRHEGDHVWGRMRSVATEGAALRRVGQPESPERVGGERGPVPTEEDP